MNYKILEAHIELSSEDSSYLIVVAIQSDVNELRPTHFKAYSKVFPGPGINMGILQSAASSGTKLSEQRAKEVFPVLTELKYY